MEHFGKIIGYSDGAYLIEVGTKADECGACSAYLFCGSSKGDKITLRATAGEDPDKCKIGSRVRIRTNDSGRMEAIAKLLLRPLFIFMLCAFIASLLGASDLVVGLSAILSLGVVYPAIYFYQRRKRGSWTITQVL